MRWDMNNKPLILLSILIIFTGSFSGCIEETKNEINLEQEKPKITKDTLLEKIVLDGLTLSGSEERNYNNTELIIRGTINVEDFSKLVIKNCKLIIEQDYNKQYFLNVKDNATFIVDNIYYESRNWRWFNWEYFNNATIRIVDFENDQEPWQTIEGRVNAELIRAPAGLTIAAKGDDGKPFNGSIFISESDKVYFEVNLLPYETYEFEFPNGFIKEWHPDFFPGRIDIYNSTITDIDIDIWPGTNVTVKNTDHFALGWILGEAFGQGDSKEGFGEIIGLKDKYYDDFTVSADNATLRIINTTLTSWWPLVTAGFELVVRDCHMIDPWAFNDGIFKIYDSYIFYLTATNEATVEIYDSIVEDSLLALESSTISLFNTSFNGETIIEENARIYIDGVLVENN
jgi:hypothetical protein